MDSLRFGWKSLLLLAVIFVVFASYWQGLNGPFLLDDFTNIHLAHLRVWDWQEALHLVTGNSSGTLGRSVSMISLIFTGFFHGLDAWWFKYHNLLLHCLIGLAFLWLGYRLLLLFVDEGRAFYVSLAVAAFWLMQPLSVSTVLYPVQRMAQMSTLWMVFGAVFYVIGRQSLLMPTKLLSYTAVGLLMLLAVLSKENGALLPLMLFALELILRQKCGRGMLLDSAARLLLVLLPLCAGMLLLSVMWTELINYSYRDFTLSERLMTQSQVIWFYIGQILFPRLSMMGLYHDYWVVVEGINWKVIASLVVIALLLWWSLIWRPVSIVAFGILWFFFGHVMESSIIPLELVFEHRNYLPSWGVLFSLAGLYLWLSKSYKNIAKFFVSIMFLFSTFLLNERVGYWASHESLAVITSTYHQNSFRASVEMGRVAMVGGQMELGREFYRRAAEINPERTGIQIFLVNSYCVEDSVPESLMSSVAEAVAENPLDFYAAMSLRSLMTRVNSGRCPSIELGYVQELLGSVSPNGVYRDEYYHLMGQVHSANNDFSRAATFYLVVNDLDPNLYLVQDIVNNYLRADESELALEYLIKTSGERWPNGFELREIERMIDVVKNET